MDICSNFNHLMAQLLRLIHLLFIVELKMYTHTYTYVCIYVNIARAAMTILKSEKESECGPLPRVVANRLAGPQDTSKESKSVRERESERAR